MLPQPLLLLLSAALSVTAAAPSLPGHETMASRRTADAAQPRKCGTARKVLIGGGPTGLVGAADFDGKSFNIVANQTIPGTDASWLLFKEPNLLYSVDENSNLLRLFNFNKSTNDLALAQEFTGSSGVVFLELSTDKTRLLGAAFGNGSLDVWDSSAADGTLKLLKQITSPGPVGPVTGRQDTPHPHQVLLDPSGRFFVANDLGTDSILVIDSKDDVFEITTKVSVDPGSGPRHGAFFPPNATAATHYFLACEISNVVQVFSLAYTDTTIDFTHEQTLPSFDPANPPADMASTAAGELVLSPDGRDVYVSNRITGNATDNVAHFAVEGLAPGSVTLRFVDEVSSGGKTPRQFSLSPSGDLLFSTNQAGELGLLALRRDAETGSLAETPVASVPLSVFGADTFGPQFVQELV